MTMHIYLDSKDEKQWMKPELMEQSELMQVKLVLRVNVTKDVTKDATKDVTKDVVKDVMKDVVKGLTERQQIILELINEDKFVTIHQMSLKTNVTTRTIKRDLDELTKKGIISREGGRKDGVWEIHFIH